MLFPMVMVRAPPCEVPPDRITVKICPLRLVVKLPFNEEEISALRTEEISKPEGNVILILPSAGMLLAAVKDTTTFEWALATREAGTTDALVSEPTAAVMLFPATPLTVSISTSEFVAVEME